MSNPQTFDEWYALYKTFPGALFGGRIEPLLKAAWDAAIASQQGKSTPNWMVDKAIEENGALNVLIDDLKVQVGFWKAKYNDLRDALKIILGKND